ncbi:uncharacterized protein LOC129961700 [Argiope bruennichi]|uniref:uncharacterized protein LOC129961700 n=1 Tax=Argiope bruennichi TaxID=94029 RepID=UPI002493E0FF|nr:uncharacterized protein LOC129961700 [Argiope bruennichi]
MSTGNASKHDVGKSSTNQNSFLISASSRILQDLSDVYINPLESVSVDADSPRFQIDSSNETPNKYPNAPQSSPIDVQNNTDISVFNEELMKCLSNLPVILLPSEESNDSFEMPVFHTEDDTRSYLEATKSAESEVVSDNCKVFEEHYEKYNGNRSVESSYVIWNRSEHLTEEGKSGSTGCLPTNGSDQMGKLNLLRVNSVRDFNRDFNRRSTFSDNESVIANCASDVSDISSEEEETASSDGGSSCVSRDRIEFEALALDSAIYPSIFKGLQHWRTLSRNKRALSLDEVNPLKALHTIDFSTTEFQLTV